jgi:hypothetical protein
MNVGVAQQSHDRRDLVLPADDRRRRGRRGRRTQPQRRGRGRLSEPLGQQHRQIVGEKLRQVLGVRESLIRRFVVCPDPIEKLHQPRLAFRGGLHIDQLGHPRREQVLVLEAGNLLPRRHPPVLPAIDPDEHLALRQVGAIQVTRRVMTRAQLEHRGSQVQPTDRALSRSPLSLELPQGRGDEDAHPLIGRTDVRPGSRSTVHRRPSHRLGPG